jgi:hypothetical protein
MFFPSIINLYDEMHFNTKTRGRSRVPTGSDLVEFKIGITIFKSHSNVSV